MDALIGNLKTHEMNRNHDQSKKEVKKDNSLMMKYKSEEDSSDDDMAYLINRFKKIARKNKGFKKGANVPRTATQNDTCYKCGKVETFIRDCPLLKAENKEYQKSKSDKEKRRDLVLNKNDRKAAADYVVKKALAAWGDSSSDSEDPDEPNDVLMVVVHEEETIFNEMFAFMDHSENEEEEDKVTLLDMKHDLNTYSLKKLRTLANVMIDSVIELTSEGDIMNAELESLNENKDKMEEKMLKMEDKMVTLESDKTKLKKQLHQINKEVEKQKGKSNGLQVEIEEKLKTSEINLGLALEKSNNLERDIFKLKDELEKSLKWTKSSKLLSNVTNQSNFNKKGQGNLNITPPFNPHSKYFLCLAICFAFIVVKMGI
ncbi:uncharacterized protein [Solanum lycopersicum]|uniref:uncharacterized protein n=1 Tax=Solanum lycopersicum TaxID=4081 RepID=UPI0037492DD3